MTTRLLSVDAQHPDEQSLKEAAEVILRGGLVAFPTETVYGLGANALERAAVERIFLAKGRPPDNPLIVHIASLEELWHVAAADGEMRRAAEQLAVKYWPGPLTLILPKRKEVPDVVTGGLDTVAVRMPDHPVALGLIRAANRPIAAPSANRSGRPSPTEAGHVLEDLSGRIDVIVDGGPATIGVESTVLDLSVHPPVVYRPGAVTVQQLTAALQRHVLGGEDDEGRFEKNSLQAENDPRRNATPPPSPGLKYEHYAPRTKCVLVEGAVDSVEDTLLEVVNEARRTGQRVGVLATEEGADRLRSVADVLCVSGARHDLAAIAHNVYRCLRQLDQAQVDVIYVEGVVPVDLGAAIMNRLRRAAAHRVVYAK